MCASVVSRRAIPRSPGAGGAVAVAWGRIMQFVLYFCISVYAPLFAMLQVAAGAAFSAMSVSRSLKKDVQGGGLKIKLLDRVGGALGFISSSVPKSVKPLGLLADSQC